MPHERDGTPWQQQAGLRSLLCTWWKLLRCDVCWREMRIDRRSRQAYVFWARVFSYTLLLPTAVWQVLLETSGQVSYNAALYLLFVLVALFVATELVTMLCRGFVSGRISIGSALRDECQAEAVHEQVLDHACIGMMIIPIFLSIGLGCVNVGIMIEGANGSSSALFTGFYSAAGLALLGLLIGIAVSEKSSRRGWRVMRFRNLSGRDTGETNATSDSADPVDDDGLDLLISALSLRSIWKEDRVRALVVLSAYANRYILWPIAFMIAFWVYDLHWLLALLISLGMYLVGMLVHRLVVLTLRLIDRR